MLFSVFGAALIVASAVLLPQERPKLPANVPPLVEVEIQVQGRAAEKVSFGLEGTQGLEVFALSTEGREHVAAVIGGYGRAGGAGTITGVSVLFFLHLHKNGTSLLEVQIANDAIPAPLGTTQIRYAVKSMGVLIREDERVFPDQTGVTLFLGEGRFAPRPDLLKSYLETVPSPSGLRRVDLSDADPVDDPDPTKDTHAPGSPRNRYHAVQAVKYLATNDRRYLDRLLDFVAQQAERPYHLSEPNGEPMFAARYPKAHFIEGRPNLGGGREGFGRDALTKEGRGGAARNGWDHEHMNVEELYAAYVLTGSRIARRELIQIAEQLLTTPYVKDEGYFQHSARAFGWVARLLVRAYQVSHEDRYLDGVRRMMRSIRKHRSTGPYPALVPQKPQNDHMKDERWESPFMVAIAASALALYCREVPADAEAKDLLRFCGDLLVDRGWDPVGQGYFYDYSVDSDRKTGTAQTNGVVLFIPSALVEVANQLPEKDRPKYLEPARHLYEVNHAKGYATTADNLFFRWFLSASKAFPTVGLKNPPSKR